MLYSFSVAVLKNIRYVPHRPQAATVDQPFQRNPVVTPYHDMLVVDEFSLCVYICVRKEASSLMIPFLGRSVARCTGR